MWWPLMMWTSTLMKDYVSFGMIRCRPHSTIWLLIHWNFWWIQSFSLQLHDDSKRTLGEEGDYHCKDLVEALNNGVAVVDWTIGDQNDRNQKATNQKWGWCSALRDRQRNKCGKSGHRAGMPVSYWTMEQWWWRMETTGWKERILQFGEGYYEK